MSTNIKKRENEKTKFYRFLSVKVKEIRFCNMLSIILLFVSFITYYSAVLVFCFLKTKYCHILNWQQKKKKFMTQFIKSTNFKKFGNLKIRKILCFCLLKKYLTRLLCWRLIRVLSVLWNQNMFVYILHFGILSTL